MKEKKNYIYKWWVWVIAVVITIYIPFVGIPLLAILLGLFIYSKIYFITEESNLQTLCWKCNRTKGSKILQSAENN